MQGIISSHILGTDDIGRDTFTRTLYGGRVSLMVGFASMCVAVIIGILIGLIRKPGEISPESKIIFQGENIQEYTKKQWEEYRGQKCSICFQDALTALNPTMTIEKQIMEKIRVHKKVTKKEAWNEAVHMLELVGIPNPEYRLLAMRRQAVSF